MNVYDEFRQCKYEYEKCDYVYYEGIIEIMTITYLNAVMCMASAFFQGKDSRNSYSEPD